MNRNNITVLRKERRRDRRRGLQIEARLGGHEILVSDLSASGFGAAIDATDRSPFDFRLGQQLRLDLTLPDGSAYSFTVEIVRPLGENGVIGGTFVDLSSEAYDIIEALLTGRRKRRG